MAKVERILKEIKGISKEKQQITYKGTPIRLSAYFSVDTLQARREWNYTFKGWRGKPWTKNTLPVRLSFKFEKVIKSFLDKQKLKEFITTKTVLQEILNTLLTRDILIHLLLPDHWLEVYQYVLKHETINITM